jgi:hypothetical protein
MSYPKTDTQISVGCKPTANKPLFKDITDITSQQLDELKLMMNWFISGYGKHGITGNLSKELTWPWIKENYNVDKYYCLHKNVTDIGYVVAIDNDTLEMGRVYDGFCTCCNRTVHGFIGFNGIKRRWK